LAEVHSPLAPQNRLSDIEDTHASPPQRAWPSSQRHWPLMQEAFAPQVCPQAPQWLLSVSGSMQSPSQNMAPGRQSHVPPAQIIVSVSQAMPGAASPFAPQVALAFGLTHLPSTITELPGQPQVYDALVCEQTKPSSQSLPTLLHDI